MKSVLESVHCEGLSRHYTSESEKSIKDLTNEQKCAIVSILIAQKQQTTR